MNPTVAIRMFGFLILLLIIPYMYYQYCSLKDSTTTGVCAARGWWDGKGWTGTALDTDDGAWAEEEGEEEESKPWYELDSIEVARFDDAGAVGASKARVDAANAVTEGVAAGGDGGAGAVEAVAPVAVCEREQIKSIVAAEVKRAVAKAKADTLKQCPKARPSPPLPSHDTSGMFVTQAAGMRTFFAYMEKYKKMHRDIVEGRAKGAKRRFLVYDCRRRPCGGWGSRLWGIANTFVWALLTDRAFVMEFTDPLPIETAVMPVSFDWRVRVPASLRARSISRDLLDKTEAPNVLLNQDLNEAWGNREVSAGQ